MAGADGQAVTIDGRAVRIVSMPAPARVPVRTVASFSFARFLKLLTLWAGVPGGALLATALPADGPGQLFATGWFFLGLATLGLNAAGIVTVRQRRIVPAEDDGERGGG